MKEIKLRQKRVRRLKSRYFNIGIKRDYKEFIYIIAKRNHRITTEELKTLKLEILKSSLSKFFNIYIPLKLNKTFTSKGILVRMGKGKGKIKTLVYYLVPNTICIILTPKSPILSFFTISKLLNNLLLKYTFLSYKILL